MKRLFAPAGIAIALLAAQAVPASADVLQAGGVGPSPSAPSGIVRTSYGAKYDPSKCKVVAKYWKGHRRFYVQTKDAGCFTSTWFKGRYPVMLSYHQAAPWYATYHHGIDIDMPVGTPIRAGVAGKVLVRPSTLGTGYGKNRMIVRSGGKDYVLGHLDRLVVRSGQSVKRGQLLGYSGMKGTETMDGPHLHFEVRPAGKRYTSAVDPHRGLVLKRV